MDAKKNNQERQELVELKKKHRIAMEHPEISFEEPQMKPEIIPQTFSEKWTNYWYHYKLVTWISLISAVLLLWFVHDIVFGPKYDLTLNIASKYTFSNINPEMGGDLEKYLEDYNGNKKVQGSVMEMQVNYSGTGTALPQTSMAGQQKLMGVLNAGEDMVFLFDQETYDQLMEGLEPGSVFMDLSAIYPDQPLIEGDKLMVQQTVLGQKWRMNQIKDKLFICVRNDGSDPEKDSEKKQKRHKDAMNFVDNLIREERPE
ncbi:MAG: hypothetical protein RR977_02920 [Oscillospiraceae bacterium]